MKTLTFDLETSGILNKKAPFHDPCQPHIVSWSALLSDETGRELQSFDCIIKPEGWAVEKEAEEVHHISTDMALAVGIKLGVAATFFSHICYLADEIVAYNAAFDAGIAKCEYIRLNREHYMHDEKVKCAMLACADEMKLPNKFGYAGYAWPKLTDSYKHFFGAEATNNHSSYWDVRYTWQIWQELRRRQIV